MEGRGLGRARHQLPGWMLLLCSHNSRGRLAAGFLRKLTRRLIMVLGRADPSTPYTIMGGREGERGKELRCCCCGPMHACGLLSVHPSTWRGVSRGKGAICSRKVPAGLDSLHTGIGHQRHSTSQLLRALAELARLQGIFGSCASKHCE